MPAIAVATHEAGGVLVVTLDQPKANVLTMAMMGELRAALAAHREAAGLKLVIVRGAGAHFSFGASVPEHERAQAPAMLAAFHALVRDVASYPVPVAALVLGRCLGGAFELALACHFVFAAPTAVFACPEIKLGVLPPVLAALGPARLGQPLAERLLLTGSDLDAKAAHAAGFVTGLAPEDTDAFAFTSEWYAQNLREHSAYSLRQGLEALRKGSKLVEACGETLADIEKLYLERLLPSHDGNAGITAFLAKQKPVWSDA